MKIDTNKNYSKEMIKAIGRGAFLTLILAAIGFAFWFHPVATALALIFCWLTFMLYSDPPEHWG